MIFLQISVYDVNCQNDSLSNTAANAVLLSWDERRIANIEREDASETDIGTNIDLIASNYFYTFFSK